MGSRGYFRLIAVLVVLLTAGTLAVCLCVPDDHRAVAYVAAEVCIVVITILLIILYRKTVRPLNTLTGGIDLLKEQDFSTRLRPVGQTDADKIIEMFNRMTRQLHDEELRAKEQNYFLELLIAASPMGVLIMNIDGKISSANPAMCRFLGIRDISAYKDKSLQETGLPLLQLISSLQPESGRVLQTDSLHIYKCTLSSFMDMGFPHPFYMIEPLTEELYEAEKRGYKKVIRIISHEVNNTMAGLTSALGAIEDSCASSGDEDTAAMLSILLSRIDRMSRFITEYASMARIPDPACRPTDANSFILRVLPFLETLKGNREITFSTDLDDNAGEVRIDPVLMEQVLTNIVKNAVEAFPENASDCKMDNSSDDKTDEGPDGGSESKTDDGSGCKIIISSRPGYWCIADNGSPIPDEVSSHLFTPFFSTKPDGKGIGLTVIHDILTRSGIGFSLSTGPDGITRFEMFLSR